MDLVPLVACAATGLTSGVLGTLLWSRRARTAAPAASAEPSSRTVSDDGGALLARAVAEHMPVAMLAYTETGLVRFANAMASELLFDGAPAVGQNFARLLEQAPPPVKQALGGSASSLFSTEHDGELQTFQVVRHKTRIGSELHILLLVNPLTSEVVRRELDVLKRVIRVMSHELNNSLATMLSLVSSGRFIAEHPERIGKLGAVLDGIEERTKHLQTFLAEYAALSRLPRPKAVEVPWDELLGRLSRQFPTLSVEGGDEAPGWFDPILVEQALINLLKNASEAQGSGLPLELVIRRRDDMIELGVLDRGPGFSDEALSFGLLPFFSTKPGGSGVGLALCRDVAESHGGALRIKSREGGGSAVFLALPVRDARRPRKFVLSLTRA